MLVKFLLFFGIALEFLAFIAADASLALWSHLKRRSRLQFISSCLALTGIVLLIGVRGGDIVEASIFFVILVYYLVTLWKILGERKALGMVNEKATKYLYLAAFNPAGVLVITYLVVGEQTWMNRTSFMVSMYSICSLFFAIVFGCKEEK